MDALELTAFVAWCFAVALAGGLVGLVLGNIRLPLVLLLATSPAGGRRSEHRHLGRRGAHRGDRARPRGPHQLAALRLDGAALDGGCRGGRLPSGLLPDDVLLAVIGCLLLYFGIDLLRPRRPRPGAAPAEAGERPLDIRAAVITGAVIGVLGGLVGLILGALRMPALLRYVGETPARAVGTNLAVGVCVGAAGVVGHTPEGVDWDLMAIGAAASVPGALLGARLTGRLSERALLRAIGAVLVVAGSATLAQALV